MAVTRSQMNALLKEIDSPIRRAYERAVRTAQGRANVRALVRAIEAGDVDAIIAAAGIREGMWSGVTEEIRAAFAQSGAFIIAADVPKKFGMEFNINNPRAERWLGNHFSKLVDGPLKLEQRGAVQTILQNGMVTGKNPRTTALDIAGRISKQTGRRQGGVIGLTQQQADAVVNMRGDLANLKSKYFNRELRDRRFDSLVRKAIDEGKSLDQATIDRIAGRYEDRLLKHRADTIARTESLAALNEANDEALRQIVDGGLAPANAVMRIWRHSFSANERSGHLAMSGQERGIGEMFQNPETAIFLLHPGAGPGSEVINCRCFVEHRIDFVAVERAA